jgi:hypothetical protein
MRPALLSLSAGAAALLSLSATPALADPGAVAAPEDHFTDEDGSEQVFSTTYERWFGDTAREPHYLSAAGSLGVLLALGGVHYYWVRLERNREDWDDPSLEDRLDFDAVRFDDNPFADNHLHHPFSGSLYHWVLRANGLGVFASAAYGFGASTLWEYAFEIRETVGLNDLIVTPTAGVAVGEFFFQLGQYVNSAPEPSPGQSALGYTIGPVNRAFRDLHGDPAAPRGSSDALGLSSAFWHRFRLDLEYAAVAAGSERSAQRAVVAEASLAAMPGFLRPGRFATGFSAGNFVAARARVAPGDASVADAELWFDTRLADYYRQELEAQDGGLRGHSWLVGWSTAFRYVDRNHVGPRQQFAIMHLAGPALDVWWARSGFLLRASAVVHLDFAAMRSLAYAPWREASTATTKSSLDKHGYYFGPGVSGAIEGALSHGALELGARVRTSRHGSIEGRDRFQETLQDDGHLTDDLLELGAFLSVAPRGALVYGRLSVDQSHQRSRLGAFSVTGESHRWSAAVGVTF